MPTADELINPQVVRGLADILGETTPAGNRWRSVRASASGLPSKTLSERARSVAAAILADCPNYADLAYATRAALANPGLAGWMIWPLSEAVATAAINQGAPEAFDDGLELMVALSPRLTSEFALRTFLNADIDRTLAVARTWTAHHDDAVRRLASEGTRPKLPWAKQVRELTLNPARTRFILDALYQDESPFVRRSVANHLNDISRLDPETAVRIADQWADHPSPQTMRVIRHGMRSLIKAGSPDALRLLGFSVGLTDLEVKGPTLDRRRVELGGTISFSVDVTNTSSHAVSVAIDYVVHHRKANNTTTPKVFKLTTRRLDPYGTITVTRRHVLKPVTTRRYHGGRHGLEVQINGQRFGYTEFRLVMPAQSSDTSERT
jgi:3-methyladenine DNA glycosylase AlkC